MEDSKMLELMTEYRKTSQDEMSSPDACLAGCRGCGGIGEIFCRPDCSVKNHTYKTCYGCNMSYYRKPG